MSFTSKNKRIRIVENAPPVNNLDDLIKLGEKGVCYHDINNTQLTNILPHLKELQQMVGMTSVKETIFLQVLYYLQNFHLGGNEEYLHTIITGPPGTGKTTVAHIIGNIYKKIGILKSNKFVIAARTDFIDKYLGHTALKTLNLLKSCIGGVLFCDELYALGSGGKVDSYSKEAIDTIVNFLSENKNNFCFIGAGYEKDIEECFFSVNQGLKRRFQWVHNIQKYTSPELVKIFRVCLKNMHWFTDMTDVQIETLIRENKKVFEFSGGSIETFLSKCKMFHSKRIFSLKNRASSSFIITKEDTENALKFIEKMSPPENTTYLSLYT